jgi:hypothetical protein
VGGQRPELRDMAEIAAGIALTLNELLVALVGAATLLALTSRITRAN